MVKYTIRLAEPITLAELFLRITGRSRSRASDELGLSRNSVQAIADGNAGNGVAVLAWNDVYGIPLKALQSEVKRDEWSFLIPEEWIDSAVSEDPDRNKTPQH